MGVLAAMRLTGPGLSGTQDSGVQGPVTDHPSGRNGSRGFARMPPEKGKPRRLSPRRAGPSAGGWRCGHLPGLGALTLHGDIVHRQLQALAAPHHPHRVPLVVVELVSRKERLGAFTCGTKGGVNTASPRSAVAPGPSPGAQSLTPTHAGTHAHPVLTPSQKSGQHPLPLGATSKAVSGTEFDANGASESCALRPCAETPIPTTNVLSLSLLRSVRVSVCSQQ